MAAPAAAPMSDPTIVLAVGLLLSSDFWATCVAGAALADGATEEPRSTAVVARDA